MFQNQGLVIKETKRFVYYTHDDHRKTMPRAIILGVFITTIVYVLVNFSFLGVLNLEEIKSSNLIVETFAFKIAGDIFI